MTRREKDLLVVVAILLTVLVAGIYYPDVLLKSLPSFLSAGFGALFGAYAAYLLGLSKQEKGRVNENYGALLRTQVALMTQLEVLVKIKEDYLDPFRDDKNRHGQLFIQSFFINVVKISFKEISFIAQTDNPNQLQKILNAEQCYDDAIGTLQQRNKFVKGILNASASNFEIFEGQLFIKPNQIQNKLLIEYTDNLYSSVDAAVPRVEKTISEISGFIKKEFRRNAIKLTRLDTSVVGDFQKQTRDRD